MSSRALRKLKGEDDLHGKEEESEEDSLVVAAKKAQREKKRHLNRNAFDVLLNDNVAEDDENEAQCSGNQEKAENSLSSGEPVAQTNGEQSTSKSRRTKTKKKKRKTKANDLEKKEENDFDDLLASQVGGATSTSGSVIPSDLKAMDTRPVLMVEHRNLNAELEMCRRFGSRVVRGDRGRSNHRRSHRPTWLVTPRPNWPKVGKTGLSMKLLEEKDGYQYFAFDHSPAYQAIQFKFLDAVESMDPNNISAIIQVYGYHIDSLLQLSEVCRLGEDHQTAAEFLERALFALECNFHPLFNLTQGKSRMSYKRAENRAFFLTLFHHIKFVGQKGCYRTALELCKLLLSLSPDEDPLCVLLMIDFYALHSGEYDFLIRLYNEWQVDKNLSQLPNFSYSVALAHFHASKETSSASTANDMLQDALINFPSVLVPLLDKCSIALEPTLMNHAFFGTVTQMSESKGLHLLVGLFIGRTHSEWKSPEVVDWLASNVKLVLERVDRNDPYIEECRKKRAVRYQGTPRNIYRHVLLSDIKEATTTLPVDLSMSPVMSYDPLPPTDSIASYTRPERQRTGVQPANPLSEFFRSILPSYALNPTPGNIMDIEGDEVIGGAAGGIQDSAANLTRGVESLMTAMRELLNTMTYRGDEDAADNNENDEEEWVD